MVEFNFAYPPPAPPPPYSMLPLSGIRRALPPAPPPPQHSTWMAVTFAGHVHMPVVVKLETKSLMTSATVTVNVALPVPPALVAVMVALVVPVAVGVPLIKPVPVSTLRPAGNPLAP